MQHAGGFWSVEIDFVGIGNDAKLRKIQVCISALQRIIGPRHLTNPEIQCPFPLCQLELASDFMLAVFVQYSKHVGVNVELAVFVSKHSQCKPDQAAAVECTHANIAGCL